MRSKFGVVYDVCIQRDLRIDSAGLKSCVMLNVSRRPLRPGCTRIRCSVEDLSYSLQLNIKPRNPRGGVGQWGGDEVMGKQRSFVLVGTFDHFGQGRGEHIGESIITVPSLGDLWTP